MSRIVVLDGFAMNPGDLDWAPLLAIAPCDFYPRTPPDQVVERARLADIVLTNKVAMNRDVLERLPTLRYIGVTATGTNIVDVAAARARGITVTNVPGYSTRSVAQATFALLLELANRAGDHAADVRAGGWSRCDDFCYWKHPLVELDGLALGLVGYGAIGREVAAIARAFGMRVLAHTRRPPADGTGVTFTDLDGLFSASDVVSLHCPLTPETRGLVNERRLGLMKPSAFLINTARGPLIDEAALAAALASGRLAGAAMDVLSAEPPPADNPLLAAPNCIITPHIAWATRAARGRLLEETVNNIRAFLAGTPTHVVT